MLNGNGNERRDMKILAKSRAFMWVKFKGGGRGVFMVIYGILIQAFYINDCEGRSTNSNPCSRCPVMAAVPSHPLSWVLRLLISCSNRLTTPQRPARLA